jgi:uncharacterized membrane protein YoaK (UPF0700 family)
VVFVTRLASFAIEKAGHSALPTMFGIKFALLTLAAAIALTRGPFTNADTGAALATGMLMVAAMAIQNAGHKIHLSSAPPTTMVTGATTQIMIDLADLMAPGAEQDAVAQRLRNSLMSVLAFAAGCAAAAWLFAASGVWCLAVPPALVVISFGWAVRIRTTLAPVSKPP